MIDNKSPLLELVCPAGTPASLRAAAAAGADTIYCGFANETNARNFPGLNFSIPEMEAAIGYAHGRGAKVYIAVNTYAQAGRERLWREAIDAAADLHADAVIVADIGLLDYAASTHPSLRRHLSVQATASSAESIRFFSREFGVKRVVLPRVLTISEIEALNREVDVETEVFVFGGLCVMAEGRCSLSSYVTGQSPNMNGVCSPACAVRYERDGSELRVRLGEFAIDVFPASEAAGYPTLCKGRFRARGKTLYLFEEPTSLGALPILPRLQAAGVSAVKIEGRQRSKAYIAEVVGSFRRAIDGLAQDTPERPGELDHLSEGNRQTAGAYRRQWR
jgi:putative protease